MDEREKVLHDLENVIVFLDARSNMATPGSDGQMLLTGWANSTRKALGLLEEQDEGIAPIESTTEQKKFADRIGFAVSEFWCGACQFNLIGHPKFCPNCGKKVKWDG